ncbi:MAG: restriction endonuclease [bacterium]
MSVKKPTNYATWMPHIIESLKDMGGSGRPMEVYERVIKRANVPKDLLSEKTPSGNLRIKPQVYYAVVLLRREKLIADKKPDRMWTLSESGKNTTLTDIEAEEILAKYIAENAEKRLKKTPKIQIEELEDEIQVDHESRNNCHNDLMNMFKEISPQSFERLCADFLRHLGLYSIRVTGGTGDRGIDGEGLLPLNDVISMRIAFQCKRLKKPVGSKEIQSFQGAMGTWVEKGIFFTTSKFTTHAQKIASAQGSKPVELIDGKKLISLMEKHQFGIKTREVRVKKYRIDSKFLHKYQSQTRSQIDRGNEKE